MSELSETPKSFMNGYLSSENGPLNAHSDFYLGEYDGGGVKNMTIALLSYQHEGFGENVIF